MDAQAAFDELVAEFEAAIHEIAMQIISDTLGVALKAVPGLTRKPRLTKPKRPKRASAPKVAVQPVVPVKPDTPEQVKAKTDLRPTMATIFERLEKVPQATVEQLVDVTGINGVWIRLALAELLAAGRVFRQTRPDGIAEWGIR